MNRSRWYGALVALLWMAGTSLAQAVPMTFTSRAGFDTAISGLTSSTVDFDATSAGTVIPDGSTFEGIAFSFDPAIGLNFVVSTGFATTSGTNYLGVDDGGTQLFLGGDGINFDFGTGVNAFGLYVISVTGSFDGDYTLTAGGASVGSDASAPEPFPAIPDDVFFLGIVDPTATFTTASLSSFPGAVLSFSVDDLVTASVAEVDGRIPEPGSLALLGIGLAGLFATQRRRRALP